MHLNISHTALGFKETYFFILTTHFFVLCSFQSSLRYLMKTRYTSLNDFFKFVLDGLN